MKAFTQSLKNFFLLIVILLHGSCHINPTPTPTPLKEEEVVISLLTANPVPGELVFTHFNIPPAQDTATILVGNKRTMAIKADSNQVVFIMPELPPKTPVVIQFQDMGNNQQQTIMVGDYVPITQPEEVIATYTAAIDEAIHNYQIYEKSELVKLDPAYGELYKYAKQQLTLQFAALTPEQRKEVAYTVRAYSLDKHEVRLDTLNPEYFMRTQKSNDPFGDPETEFLSNVKIFLDVVVKARKEIAKGSLLILASLKAGPFAPVLALTGAVIILKGVKKQVDINATYYNSIVGRAIIRILGTDVENQKSATVQKVFADGLVLEDNKERKIKFKGAFRTIILNDKTSTAPAIKQFFMGKEILDEAYDIFKSVYSMFEHVLGGDAPALASPPGSVRTNGGNKKLPMQASKLNIANVSNNEIDLSLSGEGTDVTLTATSTTITEAETDFTFDLEYTSTLTGEKVVDQISATFVLSLETFLINGSPWKITSRIVGERDDFKLWNSGNIACGPEGILYDHKHKMLEGTWSFTPGSINVSSLWERHTYNCDNGTYEIDEYFDDSSGGWMIDEVTGKLLLIDGEERASASVTVSRNKVTLRTELEDEEGLFTVINVLENDQ